MAYALAACAHQDSDVSQNQFAVKEYQNKSNTQNEFAYDPNGNMTKDLDRDIVAIRYNLLNLPDIVQFKNGNQISNKYDAGGRKLSTEYFTLLYTLTTPIAEGVIMQWSYNPMIMDKAITTYIDNKEYDSKNDLGGIPNRVYNPEGYADALTSAGGPQYKYYRRDHLGNVCEVWRAAYPGYSAATLQRTQYYPSGLPWAANTGDNPGMQNKKYNAKEFIEMHGFDTYDYGARGYYSAIGRFMSQDRFAEKYINLTPYHYAANNPIRYIDVNGDSLDVAANKESRDDINSIIKEKNQKYISYDGNRLSVNFGNAGVLKKAWTLITDGGLATLNNLSNAKENYYYEASNSREALIDGKPTAGCFDSFGGTERRDQFAATNLSVTPPGGNYPHGAPLNNDYQGVVFISPGTPYMFDENGKEVPFERSLLVKHELRESYLRTTEGSQYDPAHLNAGGQGNISKFYFTPIKK